MEKSHQENLTSKYLTYVKKIFPIENEIFFLENKQNNSELNLEINENSSFVHEINTQEKLIYDLEFEKEESKSYTRFK